MMDETQMVELLKLVQTNPQAAAKMLAQIGVTPDQVFGAGAPELGGMVNPAAVPAGGMPGGITASDNGLSSAGFSGPVVNNDQPMQQFTPQALPAAVPFQTAELPPPNLSPDGTAVAGAAMTSPFPPGVNPDAANVAMQPWTATVMPGPGAGGEVSLAGLMQGMQGFGKMAPTASADQRPIMPANAPAPRAPQQVGAPISMAALMQLIQGAGGAGVPTLGALMGRRV